MASHLPLTVAGSPYLFPKPLHGICIVGPLRFSFSPAQLMHLSKLDFLEASDPLIISFGWNVSANIKVSQARLKTFGSCL